jgi:3'(2'), 5'-bisphosphate nucleotidase
MASHKFQYSGIIDAVISSRPIVLKYFQKDFTVTNKEDDSPVTKADLEVNSHLNSAIKKLHPNSAIISEENSAQGSLNAAEVFIIDPIDGTSAFIKGSSEFSVNVALKIGENLVMGSIYSPIDDVLYHAENGELFKVINASQAGAEVLRIKSQEFKEKEVLKVIATRREEELGEIKKELERKGLNFELMSFSSSLKFCYLAEGLADCYYRMVSIKLWDVAAGFAIVKAAGLKVSDYQGRDLVKILFSLDSSAALQENDFKIPPFIVD